MTDKVIDRMAPQTGRVRKEDDTTVNKGDLLDAIAAALDAGVAVDVSGMGQVDTTAVTDPDQASANQLGLLRGLLKQLKAGTAQKAIVIVADGDIAPTIGITANTDTDATVLFADDLLPVAVKLIAGVVYPYSIIKVTVGVGVVGLY